MADVIQVEVAYALPDKQPHHLADGIGRNIGIRGGEAFWHSRAFPRNRLGIGEDGYIR